MPIQLRRSISRIGVWRWPAREPSRGAAAQLPGLGRFMAHLEQRSTARARASPRARGRSMHEPPLAPTISGARSHPSGCCVCSAAESTCLDAFDVEVETFAEVRAMAFSGRQECACFLGGFRFDGPLLDAGSIMDTLQETWAADTRSDRRPARSVTFPGPLRNRRMPAGHSSFSVCFRADSCGTLRYIGRLSRVSALGTGVVKCMSISTSIQGHLAPMRSVLSSPLSTKHGNPFRPGERSLIRMLRPKSRGPSSQNILLKPLSKASVTRVGYAMVL
jgi:hypothetical protein